MWVTKTNARELLETYRPDGVFSTTEDHGVKAVAVDEVHRPGTSSALNTVGARGVPTSTRTPENGVKEWLKEQRSCVSDTMEATGVYTQTVPSRQ